MPILADDDVIVHGDPQRFRRFDDQLGHVDIRARRKPNDDFVDGSEMKIDYIEAYSLDADWYI